MIIMFIIMVVMMMMMMMVMIMIMIMIISIVVVLGIWACKDLWVFKLFRICIKTKSTPRLNEVLVY